MTSKTLSIVIPVYNIIDGIDHLATELKKLPPERVQVIIVDDGSDDGTPDALQDLDLPFEELLILANPENAGAGVARNTGFPHATGTYTLFFDADDFLHPGPLFETIDLMGQLDIDATINRYEFIRGDDTQSTGMNVIDRELWSTYYERFRATPFTIDDAPRFLQFTNYPWNKVIRTRVFQELGLDPFFGKTRVHNDVLGHWNILMNARRIVLVNKTIVTHHVSGGRDHLTNRAGPERLEVFAALHSIQDLLATLPAPDRIAYPDQYWSFVRRLVNWARHRVQKSAQPEFDAQARRLVEGITFSELLRVRKHGDDGAYRWLMSKV